MKGQKNVFQKKKKIRKSLNEIKISNLPNKVHSNGHTDTRLEKSR